MRDRLEGVGVGSQPVEHRMIRVGEVDVAARTERQIAEPVTARREWQVPAALDPSRARIDTEQGRDRAVGRRPPLHLRYTRGGRPHHTLSRIDAHAEHGADARVAARPELTLRTVCHQAYNRAVSYARDVEIPRARI